MDFGRVSDPRDIRELFAELISIDVGTCWNQGGLLVEWANSLAHNSLACVKKPLRNHALIISKCVQTSRRTKLVLTCLKAPAFESD